MILRVNQRVFGPDVAVRPAVTVNESQNLKHAAQNPDSMPAIETRGEALIQRRQAAPKTAGMSEHQGLLALASFHDAVGNRLRQQSGEKCTGAIGIQSL